MDLEVLWFSNNHTNRSVNRLIPFFGMHVSSQKSIVLSNRFVEYFHYFSVVFIYLHEKKTFLLQLKININMDRYTKMANRTGSEHHTRFERWYVRLSRFLTQKNTTNERIEADRTICEATSSSFPACLLSGFSNHNTLSSMLMSNYC